MRVSARDRAAKPPRLSVVIPAYNEAGRLGPFLDDAIAYLETELPHDWEIIVVDDGSADGTVDVVRKRIRVHRRVRVLRHDANRGKGAAVQTGVHASRGQLIVFADADGATPIIEERRLRHIIEAGADAAIGSREALSVLGAVRAVSPEEPVHRRVRLHRYVMGRTFAFIVNAILRLPYIDTQCGFKMFRRDAARVLFSQLTQTGYIFDVELMYLARRYSYRVAEVPVNWQHIPGSKVRLLRDSCVMVLGVVNIWLSHRDTALGTGAVSPNQAEPVTVGMKRAEMKLTE